MTAKDDLILQAAARLDSVAFDLRALVDVTPPPPPPPPPPPGTGIWTSAAELSSKPTSGKAWTALLAAAGGDTTAPNLSNQDDPTNVRVLAKALVYARTGSVPMRDQVISALVKIPGTEIGSRALALGRELAAYVISADLVGYRDPAFVSWLSGARRFKTLEAGSIIDAHENRPNNWGTHCGASRVACAVYLGDTADLTRCTDVFRGWLGNHAYAGFSFGDLSWQADPSHPVGINAKGATKSGHSIDGVLPDDQRRAGPFVWPPPKENYVWEALQGAVVQAEILTRAGFLAWEWSDRALLRAVTWLHTQANFPAAGDDAWIPHLVNRAYGTTFPAPVPSSPGKNMGWTCYTHAS